jgi:hypothetical protein
MKSKFTSPQIIERIAIEERAVASEWCKPESRFSKSQRDSIIESKQFVDRTSNETQSKGYGDFFVEN